MVAKLGGVSAAGEQLHTSQSSISIQIKTLENSLNRKLFRKSGRKIVLTQEGHYIFRFCQRMFEISGELTEYLANPRRTMCRRFTIGVSEDIERPFVAEILSDFFKRSKKDERPVIKLISGTHHLLNSMMLARELNLLLSSDPNGYEDVQKIGTIPLPVFLFTTPKAMKTYGIKRGGSSRRVLNVPQIEMILPAQTLKLREEINRYFLKAGAIKYPIFESNVISAVVRATIDGIGVTMLPEAYVKRELQAAKIIRLGEAAPLWRHHLYLYTPKAGNHDLNQWVLTRFISSLSSAAGCLFQNSGEST